MDKTIKIFFAGDFCSKPSTSKIAVSEDLKELIQTCDLKVINFEVPLKPQKDMPTQTRERFFQNDDAPDFLRGLGFNLFSLANNHAFDWGDEGFFKTKGALGEAAFGAGTYKEAYEIKVMEVNGVKIGFFALSFAAYIGVFTDVAKHDGLGCAYINDLRVNHDIIEAKKTVDYLFVLPHDGIEYIDVPLPETIARYRDFIDYGADGVIAAHPHCPQGWEEYKGKPIFYSLGNFLFNSKEDYSFCANKPHWYEGLCAIITIEKNELIWESINTRNLANLGVEIDHNESRKEFNKQLCRYIKDEKLYYEYLLPLLRQQVNADLQLFKQMFLPQNIKEAIMILWNNLRRRKTFTKEELIFILKNDLKRERLIRLEDNTRNIK